VGICERIVVGKPTLVSRIDLHRVRVKRLLLSATKSDSVLAIVERNSKLLFRFLIQSEVLLVLSNAIQFLNHIALCLQVKHRVGMVVYSVTGFEIFWPLSSLIDVFRSSFRINFFHMRLINRCVFFSYLVRDCYNLRRELILRRKRRFADITDHIMEVFIFMASNPTCL